MTEVADLSHDALANELGKRSFDQDARYDAKRGKWLFWSGAHWEIDEKLTHLTRVRDFLREYAKEIIEWAELKAAKAQAKDADTLKKWAREEARRLRNKTTVASVESLARSNPKSVAKSEDFDRNRMLLGTPGGTVDLQTGKLQVAKRSDMITKLTACTPAKSGSHSERWIRFLHEIFDGDAELIAFTQRLAGYALTGKTNEHKLFFLYGTGRNGKSVFLNTLTHIWGKYARRAAAETFRNTKGDKHSTGLAGLQGSRLVAGSELPFGAAWDESVIKDLTGGDRMTARMMRGDYFDFDPQLTLLIAGNYQPSFRGVDEAIRSRVVLIPFTITIAQSRRDKTLSDQLKAEAPEILRWAIDGAVDWHQRGLDLPRKVQSASNDYMDGEDVFGQFLADETFAKPENFVATSVIQERAKLWCGRQGVDLWSPRTLQKELKSRGYASARRNHGRGFLGLALR